MLDGFDIQQKMYQNIAPNFYLGANVCKTDL